MGLSGWDIIKKLEEEEKKKKQQQAVTQPSPDQQPQQTTTPQNSGETLYELATKYKPPTEAPVGKPSQEAAKAEVKKKAEDKGFLTEVIDKTKSFAKDVIYKVTDFTHGTVDGQYVNEKTLSPVPEETPRKPVGIGLSNETYNKAVSDVVKLKMDAMERLDAADKELRLSRATKREAGFFQEGTEKDVEKSYKELGLVNEIPNLQKQIKIYDQFLGNEPIQRGFLAALWDGLKSPEAAAESILPFAKDVTQLDELAKTYSAMEAQKSGEPISKFQKSQIDAFRATAINKLIEKDLGYQVGELVVNMPSFLLSFAMTGGLFQAGEQGAAKLLPKIGINAIDKGLAPKIATSVLSKSVGTVAQSAGYVPTIANRTAQYVIPKHELIEDKKGDVAIQELGGEKDFMKALRKGYLSTYIDVASERLGGLIEEPINFLMKGVLAKFAIKTGIDNPSALAKFAKTAGWNGVIGEVFEEELAELGQAPVEERKYYAPLATPEGSERLLVETLGIGLFGGFGKITDNMLNTLEKSKKESGGDVLDIPFTEGATKVDEEKPEEVPAVQEVTTEGQDAPPLSPTGEIPTTPASEEGSKSAIGEGIEPAVDQKPKTPQSYTSATDFAEAEYSARPTDKLGLVDSSQITPRDPVDKTSKAYLDTIAKIEAGKIDEIEPIEISKEGDNIVTTDGSQRLQAAIDKGVKIPAISRSEVVLEGMNTLEAVYNKAEVSSDEGIDDPELAKIIRETKGLTADQVMEKHPDIKLKREVAATDIRGNKVKIPDGEVLTPYELKGNKVLLQDGETYIVSKNQYQNIKGNAISSASKEFAPELKETEETILSAEELTTSFDLDNEGTYAKLPLKVQKIIENYTPDEGTSEANEKLIRELKKEGYTADYDMSGEITTLSKISEGKPTKYSQYQLPDGKNYKEILIKAPQEEPNIVWKDVTRNGEKKVINVTAGDRKYIIQDEGDGFYVGRINGQLGQKVDNYTKAVELVEQDIKNSSGGFKSSHWDEPNVIAHLRMNERIYQDKKVTFMEELQSDWAREGRSKGFATEITKDTAKQQGFSVNKTKSNLGTEAYFISNPTDQYFYRKGFTNTGFDTEVEAWESIVDKLKQTSSAVPSNQLLKNWQELTIKRALKEAVDNKAEYFAWINGEQTSARYNLATYLEDVKWGKSETVENAKRIGLKTKDGKMLQIDVDKNGVIENTATGADTSWQGKKLDEVLGKGLADKIMEKEVGNLSGEGLKFGGEWASNLYDKQVKSIVEDLTGAKVEVLDMGLPIDTKVENFSLYKNGKWITSGLKQSNMKVGQNILRADGTSYVITEVLGKGKFKATPKVGRGGQETFDISVKKSAGQQAIEITPEIRSKILGEAVKLKKAQVKEVVLAEAVEEPTQEQIDEAEMAELNAVRDQIRASQDDLKGSDDPDGVLMDIADKIAAHFKAPLAKRKITGARRTYRYNGKSIMVGGNFQTALDNIFYKTDIEGFKTGMEVLSGKFNHSFTQLYARIKKGDIDGADYENFKEEFQRELETTKPSGRRRSTKDSVDNKGKGKAVRSETDGKTPQIQTSDKDFYIKEDPSNEDRKSKVTAAGTPEELKKRIEQLNKFAQANAILRKTGGIKNPNAVGQFVSSKNPKADIADEGEVRLRGKYIANDADYVAVLAHETGHAIEHNVLGETGVDTYKVFGDDLNTETKNKIEAELKAVTHELVGEAVAKKGQRYYYKSSELFARFIEKMMVSPANLQEIAPTATDLFEKQSISHPMIQEFLEAANGEIDKGVGKWFVLRDLRETYQKHLGKRVGNIVYDEEIVHRAMQERGKIAIEKFLKNRFKGVKDDPALLFRAAESIKITQGGEPVFGTRDFARPKNAEEEAELKEIGWKKVDTQIVDGIKVPVYARQRYTAEEGQAIFDQLSPKGKELIKDFTAARDEAKDYFNREVIKDVNKINGDIEGWVFHYFEDDGKAGTMGKGLKFRKKKAGTRQQRTGAEGYVEDFQKAMSKVLFDLEGEKVFNDFITRQFSRVTKPIPEGQSPEAGWIEVMGNLKKGVGTSQEKRTVVIKDGKSFVPKQPRYQMPKDIYERYKLWRGLTEEASLAVRVMNDINRYWRINILFHAGTATTNFISGGIQYSTKILTEFYEEVFTGQKAFSKTRANVGSLLTTLMPKGWADAPDWVYGADQSNFYGQFTKEKGLFSKGIDTYGNKALKLFSTYERYWKKVISLSEGASSLKGLGEMTKEGLRLPTKQERDLIADINREVDLYAYDYDNVPVALENFKKSFVGTGIKPFITYPYKYFKHILNLAGAVFDRSLPVQTRMAKLLALATVTALYAAYSNQRKKKQQTPNANPETPVRMSPKGRLFMGTKDGKELFTRVAKYPFFNLSEAGIQIVNGEFEAATDLVSEMIGSVAPLGKLGLLAFGYRSKYEQYDSVPVIVGNTISTYLPAGRMFNDISRALDPFQRKQETFLQTFTKYIPTTDAALQEKLHGTIRTERVPVEGALKKDEETLGKIHGTSRTTIDKMLLNYRDDILLSMLTGIYITRIDPKDAEAYKIRGDTNKEKKDAEAKVDQYVKKYEDGKQNVTRKYQLEKQMIEELLGKPPYYDKERNKQRSALQKSFRTKTKKE